MLISNVAYTSNNVWIKELKMALYLLKYPYRKILLPLAKKMKFIDPDILGYLATIVAFGTLFCYIYAIQKPILLIVSIILTLFRMTLNTIDGVILLHPTLLIPYDLDIHI